MSEINDLTTQIRDAVHDGATTAQQIHQEVAGLPITLLEGLGFEGDTSREIRRLQNRSIDAKTISDRFNLGMPKQHDYVFTNRKFFQGPDN